MSATDLSGFELRLRNARDPLALDSALAGSARAKAQETREISTRFFDAEAENLVVMARALSDVWRDGGRVFAMGLGAAGSEAARFAIQFQHPSVAGRRSLTAVNLAGDAAMVSAVAAEAGFDHVFAHQLAARACPGDGLIGFCIGSETPSLMAAFVEAKQRRVVTFGFACGHGGKMRTSGLVDHCLVAPTASAARAQECHLAAVHVLGDLVHSILADDPGPLEAEH
ncbi:MAG TPA: SIS domain-containing protein [Caulobacteraceae bacterium]|jgi:D-sedoheptulose 7-phosphate isomerase|nr:SIS domain-containing protein [Caulobacteraceae bacterium]